jgi:uncharacterized SAM-binding protein YcdF (DUF218 family)
VSITWLITNLLAALFLPPLNGLLLIVAGWWWWRRRLALARILVGSGALLLWLLAMPAVGDAMMRTLEGEPLTPEMLQQAEAIVVLGGGRHRAAPEYGGDTAGRQTLLRLRYAARLQRASGLPLLVTGGQPDGGALSEAETMRQAFIEDFGLPPETIRWVENASRNTQENARYTAHLLNAEGIKRIVLVTDAVHMPRALRSFAASGLTLLPAPTDFQREPLTPLDFLPTGYRESRYAMHEWIGQLWYRLRHG